MSSSSYTGIRAIMASGMKVSGGQLVSADTGKAAARRRIIPTLSASELLSVMSEEQKTAIAAKLGVKASPAKATSTAKATVAKADDAALKANLAKGFNAGRDVERARIKEVAAVALERGQAADALKMLATDADAPTIIATLKEKNLLAEAMLKRFGGAA
jgi:hypothetical protein